MCQFIVSSADCCHTPIFQRKKPRLGGGGHRASGLNGHTQQVVEPAISFSHTTCLGCICIPGAGNVGCPEIGLGEEESKRKSSQLERYNGTCSQWLASQPPHWAPCFLPAVFSFLVCFSPASQIPPSSPFPGPTRSFQTWILMGTSLKSLHMLFLLPGSTLPCPLCPALSDFSLSSSPESHPESYGMI